MSRGHWKMRLVVCTALLFSVISVECCRLESVPSALDKAGPMPKVTQELQTLYDEYSAYLTSHRPGTFEPSGPFARVVGDQVVIDAVASVEVDDLKADLEALGMRQAVAVGRVVSGRIPIASIPAMAALPTLKFAGPAPALIPRDPR